MKNDPRIVEVLAAFQRCAASSFGPEQQAECFVSAILCGCHSQEGMFSDMPQAGLLALLETYLEHAPDLDIDTAVATARAQIACLLDAERVNDAERRGIVTSSDFNYRERWMQEIERVARESNERQQARTGVRP